MSVLRSLLTAGVLASGLLWSLNGITATPAAQASDDRYEVTQQRNPDAACLDCHKPDTEGMHGKHASVINPNNKLPVKRRTKNAKAFHDKCENFSFRASNETAVLITAFYSLHGDHLGYG